MAIDREQLNLTAQAALRRAALALGWHVVRADAYSPIADLASLPADAFARAAAMPGLELDLDAQLALLSGELGPPLTAWQPPLDPPGDELGFHLNNPFYGPLDANVLYALLRARRPARVLELGSGYSTLVIARAALDNARDGAPLAHTVVDPELSPLALRPGGAAGVAAPRMLRTGAERLPVAEFDALAGGDVLFVDTSHAVRIGGEVVTLVLERLGALAPGVLVHFHDIFRPFEYPRLLLERYNKHWQEHYLLQAFLAYNPEFEVLLANHALARLRFAQVRELVPALTPAMAPSGFWFRRLGPVPAFAPGPERA